MVVAKKCKTTDSENEKRNGSDSSVKLENGTVRDDVEEVAD